MSTPQTIVLGAIAGLTIFLGLPIGRVRTQAPRTRAFLNAIAAGILVYLLFDILAHATEPVEQAVKEARAGDGTWARFFGLSLVYGVGFGVGLLSLYYFARTWTRRAKPDRTPGVGPGAMAAGEAEVVRSTERSTALRAGMSIAAGIGLHNFSEGLAIGQSAHSGQISLAALLIIGFALHNSTEGFGIVGPLAAAGVRAPWRWLVLAGVVGGGPTFLGTLVGTSLDSLFVYVGCLALAGGAILYVLGEVLPVGRRLSWEVTLWGLLVGVLAGVATEMVIAAAGG